MLGVQYLYIQIFSKLFTPHEIVIGGRGIESALNYKDRDDLSFFVFPEPV